MFPWPLPPSCPNHSYLDGIEHCPRAGNLHPKDLQCCLVLSSVPGKRANPLGWPVLGQHGSMGCVTLSARCHRAVPKGHRCDLLQREVMGRAPALWENMDSWNDVMGHARSRDVRLGELWQVCAGMRNIIARVGLWVSHQEPAQSKMLGCGVTG